MQHRDIYVRHWEPWSSEMQGTEGGQKNTKMARGFSTLICFQELIISKSFLAD